MSAVAEVLNGAADLIERDGWTHHQPRGIDGQRCANKAVQDAAPTHDLYWAAKGWLGEVVGTHATAGWNDTPGRTKDEVVAALRAAAERAS